MMNVVGGAGLSDAAQEYPFVAWLYNFFTAGGLLPILLPITVVLVVVVIIWLFKPGKNKEK